MAIDTIRSQARHIAWKVDNQSKNYNPFARSRSYYGSASRDEEQGLPNSNTRYAPPDNHSDTCLSPEVESDRITRNHQENADFEAPHHAATMPAQSTPNADRPQEEIPPNPTTLEQSTGTLVGSEDTNGGKTRRRRKFFNIKHRSSTDEKADLEKAPTRQSQSSKHAPKLTPWSQLRAVLFSAWINVLLIAVPIGFALEYSHQSGTVVFVVNFVAIIPLAAMLSFATEELALRVGEVLGGLLNATFGNAVELIVSVQALLKGEIVIVKTSLIGSMLSNLLLVMGMAFFLGGVNRVEQFFNVTVAQTAASLLALSIGSLIVPTVFRDWTPGPSGASAEEQETFDKDLETRVEALSRGTSIILLFVYGCYLLFQLKSHREMYNAPSQKVEKRKSKKVEEGAVNKAIAQSGAGTGAVAGGDAHGNAVFKDDSDSESDDEEVPQLSVLVALITLGLSTALIAFCSEFMVSSIDEITKSGGVSKTFVGLILLPIVGNAAEHATSVAVAIKDKMDLAIGVAVGSSMQIALLVLPLVDVLGWITKKADCNGNMMSLNFDGFQLAVLFVAVLLVNYLIQDGKSHWLEGVLLMTTYIIIAVAAWFYPTVEDCSATK